MSANDDSPALLDAALLPSCRYLFDATVYEQCRAEGFNPFGSGPTPIFLRSDVAAPEHGTGEAD
ncbi:hypothetical protein GCM10007148_03300 [Parvularcula lutaonensis]|nr:hypothetical protein GCM10007148_03300 [Parvularcula lutaonensis]